MPCFSFPESHLIFLLIMVKGRARKTKKFPRNSKPRKFDRDQIASNLLSGFKRELDVSLPGGGEYYCIACDRHFVNAEALTTHKEQRTHKRRLKAAEEDPYIGPVTAFF